MRGGCNGISAGSAGRWCVRRVGVPWSRCRIFWRCGVSPTVDVVHRCGFGPQLCRSACVQSGVRVAGGIEASAGLCGGCSRLVRRCVGELPGQWLQLRASLGESRVLVGGGGRRPKPGASVPINLGTDALMRDIVRVLHDGAVLLAPVLNVVVPVLLCNPSSVSEFRGMSSAVDLLRPNVERLAVVDGGVEVAKRIVHQHRRAVRQLGESPQREMLHLPCPRCGRQLLVREVQDRRGWSSGGGETPEVVRCLGCQEEWTESEYAWLSRMVISERDESDVLKWLVAEAQWKLGRLERLASLSAEDLEGIDAAAVVAMVREIVA